MFLSHGGCWQDVTNVENQEPEQNNKPSSVTSLTDKCERSNVVIALFRPSDASYERVSFVLI